MSDTMKIWERIVDGRLRQLVNISHEQFAFMPGRSITDASFALWQLTENYMEGQQTLHCIFIDLEKAYDQVPRDEVWNCLQLKGVCEKYIRLIIDMYERRKTQARCTSGTTDEVTVVCTPEISTKSTTLCCHHGLPNRIYQ